MNTFGLIIGILTLFIIGLGFVWVIFGERYFSYLWWLYVIILGVIIIGFSLFIENDFISAVVGVLGASFVWGATELKAQAVRSELGWYKYHDRKIPAPLEKLIRK
jgi:drug/metabolite transporter (DMT)-like permease